MDSALTPLLSRRTLLDIPSQNKARYRLSLVAGLIAGGAIGAALSASDSFEAVELPLMLVFFWIAVAVHEAGHVAAGLLTGFAFRGVTVCGLTVAFGTRGWRVAFEWRQFLHGGRAYMMARTPMEDWRYVAMIAAAPLASILLFAGALLWHAHTSVVAMLGWFTAMAVYPRVGLAITDTAFISMILRKTTDWERLKRLLPAQTLNFDGVRPREWDAPALAQAIRIEGGHASVAVQSCTFSYISWVDSGNYEEAGAALERALELTPGIEARLRGLVYLMAAGFLAARKQDAVNGRAWLEEARKVKGLPKTAFAPAEAAVLLAEGSFDRARAKAAEALKELRRRPFSDATTAVTIEDLIKVAESARAGCTTITPVC